jgi:DinB superfamily
MSDRFGTEWIAGRLESTFSDLEWIVGQIPDDWGSADPSGVLFGFGPDSWSAQTILAHLCSYEGNIAIPVLKDLRAGGGGRSAFADSNTDFLREFPEETKRLSTEAAGTLLGVLGGLRKRQLELVRSFGETEFNRPVKAIWPMPGHDEPQSAGWAAAKTVLHTWEHGITLFQIALLAPR